MSLIPWTFNDNDDDNNDNSNNNNNNDNNNKILWSAATYSQRALQM